MVMVITDGSSTLSLHIGDGAAVARERDSSSWLALSWPEHGEYASTTVFLTDEAGARARIQRHEVDIDRLVVFTDGIERLALDFTGGLPHSPFFAGVTAPVAASQCSGFDGPLSSKLGQYLVSAPINDRTDDDKTLIVAVLR